MSLYGIETEDDCKKKFDELWELHRIAEQQMNKETIGTLKHALGEYYKKHTFTSQEKMTAIESAVFFPAIQDCWVHAPNLNDRSTWNSGLHDIQDYLTYWGSMLGKEDKRG